MVYLKTESDMDQLITNGANIMYLSPRKIKEELKNLLTLQPIAPLILVLIALQDSMIIDENREKNTCTFMPQQYPLQFLQFCLGYDRSFVDLSSYG